MAAGGLACHLVSGWLAFGVSREVSAMMAMAASSSASWYSKSLIIIKAPKTASKVFLLRPFDSENVVIFFAASVVADKNWWPTIRALIVALAACRT
jgi:hypothetical protein